ncbi:MAG: Prolyl endopeptidase, partial [Pseudomonadota bacterium]
MRLAYWLAAALIGASMPSTAQEMPKAAVKNLPEVFFGTTVDDPYRYMEEVKNPDVAKWMKAHANATNSTLSRIAGRKSMLDSIVKYSDAVESLVSDVVRAPGDLYFYEKRGAKENQFKLYMRKGLTGAEKLLVDPEVQAKATGKPHAINYFNVSPTGSHVAYGMSKAGDEDAVLHVIDTATGKLVGKPVDRAQFGGVVFSPDGKTIGFNRLQALKKGMPETEKYQKSVVYSMPLAGPVARAKPVFGMTTPGVSMQPAEIPFISISDDDRWVFGFVINGTQRDFTLYAAPQGTYLTRNPGWRKVFDAKDKITGVAYMNNALYMLTYRNASRFEMLKLDISSKIDLAAAQVVVPGSERVLTGMAAAKDALYFEARDGNIKRLFKLPYVANAAANAQPVEVKLPVQGAFDLAGGESNWSAADPRFDGVTINLQGWTRARQIYQVNADGSVVNTGLQPKGPYDAPTDVTATEVMVKSHDGAMVPMSIIHKTGLKLDGTNPTILYGYASYG